MTKRITKAIFPAAGFGTRFLPATKSQPKEMLPIVDKPVIQYLVEEAVASGITEIVIVTGRGKRAIEDHFDASWELEHNLVEKGKHNLLKEVRKISRLAKFIYVRQDAPRGDGHAIRCAKEIMGNEPFVVLFGDDIIDSRVPATKQLIDMYKQYDASIVALEQVERSQVGSYGIIKPAAAGATKRNGTHTRNPRLHAIETLIEKPTQAQAPSNLAIIGKYVLTPAIWPALERAKPSRDGEIRLIDGLRELVKKEPVYGLEIDGTHYDTGHKFGFITATIDFALKNPELAAPLRAFLKKRI